MPSAGRGSEPPNLAEPDSTAPLSVPFASARLPIETVSKGHQALAALEIVPS
jgi:hypothetical protein